jgi:hypothetical protein
MVLAHRENAGRTRHRICLQQRRPCRKSFPFRIHSYLRRSPAASTVPSASRHESRPYCSRACQMDSPRPLAVTRPLSRCVLRECVLLASAHAFSHFAFSSAGTYEDWPMADAAKRSRSRRGVGRLDRFSIGARSPERSLLNRFSTGCKVAVSTEFGEPARFARAYACFGSEVGDAGDGVEEAVGCTW